MSQTMQEFFKSHIQSIQAYEPGKPIKELQRELGLRNITKLASNENPLGTSKKAMSAMRQAILESHLYPEGSCYELIRKIAAELDVEPNQLIVGNGSNEIIELVMRGFVSAGDEVLCSEKSFLVYPILTQVCGAHYVSVPMTEDYRYDLEAMLSAITEKTKVIFIANPNNPTGTYVTDAEVQAFLAKVPENILVCFDEAYVDFVDQNDFPKMLNYLKDGRRNLLVMRTFSKAHGLAGLRIGYAVGQSETLSYLHKIRQPFNVNSIAQAGALAALGDRFFLWRTKRLTIAGRQYFYKRFKQLGLRYFPSQANFVMVDTGYDANLVFQALLKKGMIIRSMKSYGFDTWIRVTVGRRSQNALFYRLLKEFLNSQ